MVLILMTIAIEASSVATSSKGIFVPNRLSKAFNLLEKNIYIYIYIELPWTPFHLICKEPILWFLNG